MTNIYLLINNYASKETMPYIVSTEKFSSYDAAMTAAKNCFEDAMVNEYTETYTDDQLETEVANNSLYIKGPDFLDWWTVIELPNN